MAFGKQTDGFTVAVERSDIDVGLATMDGANFGAAGNVRVYERAKILILLAADTP